MTDMGSGPDIDLDAIEARAVAATPKKCTWPAHKGKACPVIYDPIAEQELLAAAVTDIPALISRVRQQDARIAELETKLADEFTARGVTAVIEERSDAIARAEAAEKRVAELEAQRNAALNFAAGDNERADEYMARRQRAEAACAQMRDVLVRIFSTTPQTKHVTDMIRPLLATDVGRDLAEYVRLLEAVVKHAALYEQSSHPCNDRLCEYGRCNHRVAEKESERLCIALAALDAHKAGKQGGK